MEKLKKFVHSSLYTIFIDVLIIISILFIIVEKFLNIGIISYKILINIDIIILIIFSVDFALRLFANRVKYFIEDYGWIDFLAILPVFVPFFSAIRVLRIMRAARVMRILRLLRVLRVLKILKTDDTHTQVKQAFVIPISALLMLFIVVGGGFVISSSEKLLDNIDTSNERELIEDLEGLSGSSERQNFIDSSEIIIKTMNLSEIQEDSESRSSVYRKGDTSVQRFGSMYIVFSRESSRRYLNIMEGCLYIFAILSTLLISLLSSYLIDNKVMATKEK